MNEETAKLRMMLTAAGGLMEAEAVREQFSMLTREELTEIRQEVGAECRRSASSGEWWLILTTPEAAFVRAFGEIPDGYRIVHYCGNPSCVNPEHLHAVHPEDAE